MKKLFLLLFISSICFAQTQETRKKHFLLTDGVAISGYDPVSYFEGKPKKGNPKMLFNFNGINYAFSNNRNLETFKANPMHYEPMYGGWCAYAMGASGEKVEVDPESYKVLNDKLYLFYKSVFNHTLNKWNDDETHLKKQADQNWTKTFK